MTEAIKFQVADLLSQAEGKLSKAGLESIQSMLRSKTPDWLDELRNEIGVIVKSWTLSKLPNLNYLHIISQYLLRAKDSAPAWEITVTTMMTVLQDVAKNNVGTIDKIVKVLGIWIEKDVFDKQTVSQWRKAFLKLRESAAAAAIAQVSDTASGGVALVSEASSSGATSNKKRARSPYDASDPSTPRSKSQPGTPHLDEYAEALRVQTIQFLSRIFHCLHDQYEVTLRESGRNAVATDGHTSLNVVMFSSFYLLQHFLYEPGVVRKNYDPVALATACIFVSGKSEYFFIKCERLRTVAQKFVQQCFGSSTMLPAIHVIYEHETSILGMLGYDTSDLAAECPYIVVVKMLAHGGSVEGSVCRKAIELLCGDAYLQSQDCVHFTGAVIAVVYLLLGDRVGNHFSRKLKEYVLSFGKKFVESVHAMLCKMHVRDIYSESSFKDTIGEVMRRVKKWISQPELFHNPTAGSSSTTPAVTVVSESPSSVNHLHKTISKGNTPDLRSDSPSTAAAAASVVNGAAVCSVSGGSLSRVPVVSGASETAGKVDGVALMSSNNNSSNRGNSGRRDIPSSLLPSSSSSSYPHVLDNSHYRDRSSRSVERGAGMGGRGDVRGDVDMGRDRQSYDRGDSRDRSERQYHHQHQHYQQQQNHDHDQYQDSRRFEASSDRIDRIVDALHSNGYRVDERGSGGGGDGRGRGRDRDRPRDRSRDRPHHLDDSVGYGGGGAGDMAHYQRQQNQQQFGHGDDRWGNDGGRGGRGSRDQQWSDGYYGPSRDDGRARYHPQSDSNQFHNAAPPPPPREPPLSSSGSGGGGGGQQVGRQRGRQSDRSDLNPISIYGPQPSQRQPSPPPPTSQQQQQQQTVKKLSIGALSAGRGVAKPDSRPMRAVPSKAAATSAASVEREPGEVHTPEQVEASVITAAGADASAMSSVGRASSVTFHEPEEGECVDHDDPAEAGDQDGLLLSPGGFLGEDDCCVTEVPDVPRLLNTVVSQPNLLLSENGGEGSSPTPSAPAAASTPATEVEKAPTTEVTAEEKPCEPIDAPVNRSSTSSATRKDEEAPLRELARVISQTSDNKAAAESSEPAQRQQKQQEFKNQLRVTSEAGTVMSRLGRVSTAEFSEDNNNDSGRGGGGKRKWNDKESRNESKEVHRQSKSRTVVDTTSTTSAFASGLFKNAVKLLNRNTR